MYNYIQWFLRFTSIVYLRLLYSLPNLGEVRGNAFEFAWEKKFREIVGLFYYVCMYLLYCRQKYTKRMQDN